jgi:predicted nucleic acid-binding protein
MAAVEEGPAAAATRLLNLSLMRSQGLTACDAAHIELAQRLGMKLFTLDQAILGPRIVFNWIE